MKTHFDKQIEKIKAMLSDKIADLKLNPNLFEENKQEYINVLHDQMNKMEFAREVHNHYVLTGEVKIPDLNAKNLPANLSGENEGKFSRNLYYIKDKNEFFKWSW